MGVSDDGVSFLNRDLLIGSGLDFKKFKSALDGLSFLLRLTSSRSLLMPHKHEQPHLTIGSNGVVGDCGFGLRLLCRFHGNKTKESNHP